MTAPTPIPSDARRIAVVMPTWVGDCVMATPVLRALRTARPDAHITGIMRPGLSDVLAGNPRPWLDEIITDANRGILGPFRARSAMRPINADAVLLLPNSLRWAITAALARIPTRIGYDRDGRRNLLTHRLTPPARNVPVSTITYYCDLAAHALGLDVIDDAPQLFVSTADYDNSIVTLAGIMRPYLLLNPGANKPAKRWPLERFAEAAAAIAAQHNLSILATGSPAEADLLARLVNHGHERDIEIINLIEKNITLATLKPIIVNAALLITNDTGPRHFAIALGTPVISLFGPTDHRWTMIDCPTERRLLAEPFLPAELVADRCADACSITRIEVADVIAAAAALLNPKTAPAAC